MIEPVSFSETLVSTYDCAQQQNQKKIIIIVWDLKKYCEHFHHELLWERSVDTDAAICLKLWQLFPVASCVL
jgi:hypothetical protein